MEFCQSEKVGTLYPLPHPPRLSYVKPLKHNTVVLQDIFVHIHCI